MRRDGNEKEKIKWCEWEQTKDKRIVQNATFNKNLTFIGLDVETMAELTGMKNSEEEQIVFTDRVNILDTKEIAGTQKIFQVMGETSVINNGS